VAASQPGLRDVTGRFLAIALVLVTAACGSSTAHASKPSATPTATPSALVTVLPTATPGGTTDLSVTQVGFTCSLPAVLTSAGGDFASYNGGFISFPAGTLAQDPNGLITTGSSQQEVETRATPVLRGVPQVGPTFYDAAVHRWVPVSAAQSSPDGSTYAYAVQNGSSATFHIVDVAHDTERTFNEAVPSVGVATGVQVMDYDGSGVYFAVTQFEGYPVGVWRLDASTGKVAALARVANVMAVRGGYAWGGAVDPHDPSPPKVPASRSLFNSIVQVNLSNGAQTEWFYSPGRSETLLGLASGRPVINIGDGPDFPAVGGEIRLLDHPSSGAEDTGQLVYGGGVALSDPQADGDRLWFGSDRGVYLYTADGGLQKVFALSASQVGSITAIAPAGFCR
jgi:hypothetical protein